MYRARYRPISGWLHWGLPPSSTPNPFPPFIVLDAPVCINLLSLPPLNPSLSTFHKERGLNSLQPYLPVLDLHHIFHSSSRDFDVKEAFLIVSITFFLSQSLQVDFFSSPLQEPHSFHTRLRSTSISFVDSTSSLQGSSRDFYVTEVTGLSLKRLYQTSTD